MSEKEMNTSKQPEVKKEKKVSKPAEQKPGLFARIGKWVRELRSELKKVVWPTWAQVMKNALTVVLCVVIVGAFIWAFDIVAKFGVEALLKLGSLLG